MNRSDNTNISYRIIEKPDRISYDEIADVLHDAHRSNISRGMNFLASKQTGAEIEKRFGDNGKFFTAITDDNQIAGVGAVTLHQSCKGWYGKNQPYSKITMVGVPEKYKGHGISSALYREMEKYGFSVFDLMVMNTAKDNYIVLDSNARHGWKYVDYKSFSQTDYYSPCMAKWKDGCPYSDSYCKIMYTYRKLITTVTKRKDGRHRLLFRLIKKL